MTFEYSPAEIKKVKRVQFGVLSPDEIRTMSVCEVQSTQTFENGLPKESGLMDPRMGTVDKHYRCKSCSGTRDSCPGHFGHIELARPCYHVGFLGITLRILRCVCYHCSRLLCNIEDPAVKPVLEIKNVRERLVAISLLCEKKKTCGYIEQKQNEDERDENNEQNPKIPNSGCGNEQPRYRKGTGVKIEMEFPKKDQGEDRKQFLSAKRVFEIFSRISDSDCRILGFNVKYCRPHWLLVQVLPVSPPAVRPFVLMDGVRPSQDDITHKLYDILKTNNALKRQEARGVPEHVLEELVELLQFHITTMFDNEVSGQPQAKQKSGKPIKSLRQRLVGKAGRVRGNLMGKRCDFSARTVIGGDPNLAIDQVGVPRSIALNLTYPERVTKHNLHKMKELVENGADKHPGAKTIIRDDGKQIDLRFVQRTSDVNLEAGYIVERHIQDGDIVLFNRQPSLHKMSMMAHFVKILPWSTFRINLSVTSPYNADFDGDEMNLHVPQSENARSELISLCCVPTQIVSPQSNRPVMGIVQDTLLGVRKFTQRDLFLERHEVYNLLMLLNEDSWDGTIPIPCILKPKPLWTGKQILSLIIPKVNLQRVSNGRPDDEEGHMSNSDTLVRIEQGELLSGIVDKVTVGASAGSLIHVIWNEHGPIPTKMFLSSCNRLISAFLLMYSSSIGIGDTIASKSTLKEIDLIINSAKKEVARTITKARRGELQRQPGSTLEETFENTVNRLLNGAMNDAGKAVKKALHKYNNIKQMVDAGSKGNMINISQIIACVGQQNVQGKRIPYGFSNRTLTCFNKGDLGPEARGFVANSYLQGLTPQEVFFHAMGGREGLVDTAVKTASTGYIQRRLIKAMEDIVACYDRTVRNSQGHIIQFLYGEDGLDAVRVERQTMPHIMLKHSDFRKMYEFDILQGNENGDAYLLPSVKETIRNDATSQIILRQEIQQLEEDKEFFKRELFQILGRDCNLYLPVNIARLIWNAQKEFGIYPQHQISELNPVEIIRKVQELCSQIIVLPSTIPPNENNLMNSINTAQSLDSGEEIRREAQENATLLFKMLIRAMLASKRVINEFRLTRAAFNFVYGEIKARFDDAIVHPGEDVGTIAAQSIGEPATQMTLNTFHYAGVSAKNVTLGVPRLHELINVAREIKTPSLTVYLQPDIACDQNKTKDILNKLEYCRLRDIVAKTQIYYDPDPKNCIVEEDREFLEYFFDFPDNDMANYIKNSSPWMLRLVIDRAKKEYKNIPLSQIADKINDTFGGDLKCLFSNDNAPELVLQIRLLSTANEEEKNMEEEDNLENEETFLRRLEEKLLNEIELRGIRGISKVFMRQEDKGHWDDNGAWLEKSQKEWVLETEGTALLEVMAVDEVDHSRTTSNHVCDIFEVLGIEAARQALMNEIRNVLSFDGSYVNYRHAAILVDTMTYQGHLMSITRHGINRRETGPMMRCSFEETVEILLEASHFSEPDDLFGVSENIMLGQLVPVGTGAFDVLLDQEMLQQHAIEPDDLIDDFITIRPNDIDVNTPSYNSQDITSPIYDSGLNIGMKSPLSSTPAFSPTKGTSSPLPMSPLSNIFDEDKRSINPKSYSNLHQHRGSLSSSNYSPTSPTSPPCTGPSSTYSPTSPTYTPTSPGYSPTSPHYSPTSPQYSPTSPHFHASSPNYSPTSPNYSPTSPNYSPTSPNYSPTSPNYSPTSPNYSPTSPNYSPTSPHYSPTSPNYSPTSPKYSPTSPGYSPTSPAYTPTSPQYSSPTSPAYSPNLSPSSPTSPSSPMSPSSPTSPTSPTSPSSPTSSPRGSPYTPSSPGSPQYSPTWQDSNSALDYSSSTSTSDPSHMHPNIDEMHITPSESSEISSTESADESGLSSSDQPMSYDQLSTEHMSSSDAGKYSPFMSD